MDYQLDTVYPVLIGAFSWFTIYFILCLLNPKRSYEWNIRMVTLIHGLVVTILGAYSILVLGPWPFTNSGGASTTYQQLVISISLSYFLLDFSWCLYFRTEGPLMLFHHTLSIVGLSTCYITQWWGTELVATVFGAEITNPLLQLRWFLRETNRYNTLLGDIVDASFMILFGVFRIGIGSCLLYSYYQQDTDWLGRLAGTLIYSVGWLFWISIVQYAIKKFRRRYGKKTKSNTDNHTQSNGIKSEVNGNLISSNSKEGKMNGHEKLRKRPINGVVKQTVNQRAEEQ